jgi:hypothetical protein
MGGKFSIYQHCYLQIFMKGDKMKNQKGDAVIGIILIYAFIILLIGTGWVKNIIKLSDFDFEAPYKAEIIHGVGIIPLVGAVTGWLNIGR